MTVVDHVVSDEVHDEVLLGPVVLVLRRQAPRRIGRVGEPERHSVEVIPAVSDPKASRNPSGSFFPLRSALRRIPAHALGESEYLERCSPVVSKTSDNEHTTATLGDSELRSVQNPVADPVPAFDQRPEDGSKIPSSVR